MKKKILGMILLLVILTGSLRIGFRTQEPENPREYEQTELSKADSAEPTNAVQAEAQEEIQSTPTDAVQTEAQEEIQSTPTDAVQTEEPIEEMGTQASEAAE